MKNKGVIIGIIIVIVLTVGIALLPHKAAPAKQVAPIAVQPTPTPTPAVTSAPIANVTSKQYSAAEKAQIRAKFIQSCQNTLGGSSYAAQCTCGADYLRDHYTDDQLAAIYTQFYTSKQIPAAVKSAADACASK